MSGLAWTALIVSTAIDGAVFAAMLFSGRARIGIGRLALALLAAGFVCGVKLAIVFAVALFFAIHLAYVDLVVLAPLCGAAVLIVSRRRPVTAPVRALAAASLLLAPFGVYATFVEPFRLVEERASISVSAARAGRDPLRIAVLADIQSSEVDDHLRAAVARAMAFEPHLILLPGDLIQGAQEGDPRIMGSFGELLRPLRAPLGVYFVLGNTDDSALVVQALMTTEIRVLIDGIVELEHGDRRIVLGGASSHPGSSGTRELVRRLESMPGDDVRILVSHFPDIVATMSSPSRIDLVVAGHTHGGQVQIPGFGPPITLSSVPRRVAAGGLHDLGGRRVYVSRGLGCERGLAPRVRFLAPPEVSLLTIEAE